MPGIKIAVPLYRDRLSARFECAAEAMVIKAGGGKIISRKNIRFHSGMDVPERVALISKAGAALVVCCRPSIRVSDAFRQYGISEVETPLLQTDIDDIVEYVKELSADVPTYAVNHN